MNTRYTMHDPPHPGEVLKELYLVPLDLTVTEARQCVPAFLERVGRPIPRMFASKVTSFP
jgi:hypothetical protein